MEDIKISRYMVNKPYPRVKIECPNLFYASLLQDDYAAMKSEYTAVSQYVYAHILADDRRIEKDFLGIAIVEMKHLEMLGDVILSLGGNPVFRSGCGNVWNSNFVPYGCSTRSRLQLAIKGECEAIEQYRNHISRICNDDIRALLERIIEDEELHIKIFKRNLEKYCDK